MVTPKQIEDVWSLGCILSEAATFVVLGHQGLLQYEIVRRAALSNLGIKDLNDLSFHDGNEVLSEVRDWHEYLRSACRIGMDKCTRPILNLLDREVLVSAKARCNAQDLSNLLGVILYNSAQQDIPVSRLQNMLRQIDTEIKAKAVFDSGVIRSSHDQPNPESSNPTISQSLNDDCPITPTMLRSLDFDQLREDGSQLWSYNFTQVGKTSPGSMGKMVYRSNSFTTIATKTTYKNEK